MAEKLDVGNIVEGKVVRLKPFGAIVSLPDNSQGLVHISHISTSFVQNIADHLAVGDIIKVKILSMDPETGKTSLSIKDVSSIRPKETEKPAQSSGDFRQKPVVDANSSFEDKFKEWLKVSNERHAGLNKRNKRR